MMTGVKGTVSDARTLRISILVLTQQDMHEYGKPYTEPLDPNTWNNGTCQVTSSLAERGIACSYTSNALTQLD
jgi:hypothetical protein